MRTEMLKFGSKNDVTVVHRATIRLLDDAEIIHCDFQPQHKGRYILEYVCKQLNIMETDYFGLRYVDQCRQRHWLDLAKTAIKQVKDMDPILFSFRVKFYPPDPLRLKEEITRYQIYQQLKRDLLHGRLYCSPGEAALLAACIVHSELGEYDPDIHEGNYIAEHKLLLKQTEAIEEKAMKLHQTQLKGFTPEQAETHFLRLASQLDTYAVDPHPVKDHKGTQLYLGINHCGILTFQGSRQTSHFRWSEVQKINYEGKMFIVHLTINEKKHTVGFKCPTGSNCRHVWRCAIEQMLFFTLPRASDAPVVSGGSIFSWGTKFKYTGRTEREVLEESAPLRKEEPPIQRCQTSGLRRKASSVPATPSTPSQDLVEIRYSSLPRSCHSSGLDGAGMSDGSGAGVGIGSGVGSGSGGVPLSSPYCPDNTLPLLETVSEDQEIHAKRKNAIDESESHASAVQTSTTKKQLNAMNSKTKKLDKSTNSSLSSQRIVIGSEEIARTTENIDTLVRRKINEFDKNPKIIKSTALIIKTSRGPSKKLGRRSNANIIGRNNNIVRMDKKIEATSLKTTNPTLNGYDNDRYNDLNHHQTSLTNNSLVTNNNTSIPTKIIREKSVVTNTNGRTSLFSSRKTASIDEIEKMDADLRNGIILTRKRDLLTEDDVDSASIVGQRDGDQTNDYFFRDSFDHSSSESQLVDSSGKPHSRSITPVPKMQKLQNAKLCLQAASTGSSGSSRRGPDTRTKHQQSLQIVRLFIPAFLLTVVVLFIVIVVIFETDAGVFNGIRKTPEMVALRNQYYGPIKEFIRTKLGLF